ncbi:protealysin inhibitor emfourin [Longispora sp. NPDC051575]|uniref:protealysin inhibitor emfourin n=1 Tax=Longispora sp. NPDC051575 TaxID=3154943 RepID=UPI00343DE2EB
MIARIVTFLTALLVVGAATPAPAAPGLPRFRATGAYQVAVRQTGGFAGVDRTVTLSRWTAHVDAPRVLELAGGPGFRALAPTYSRPDLCCDRFNYEVTVSYLDGAAKTVTLLAEAPAPKVLRDVIDETLRIGTPTARRVAMR